VTHDTASDLDRVPELVAARGCRLGTPFRILAETGSTNDDAKAGARAGEPHGAVWLAETQSRGRGRQGRTWLSPPGENLLFSVLFRISCAPARVPPLSLVCGLAVRDAVARAIGDDARVLVKWPNDVVVRSDESTTGFRKVAGILVESALAGSRVEHLVVGIGVNVHTKDFPEDLRTIATSVALEGSKRPDRAEILADIFSSLDRDLENVAFRGLPVVHSRLEAADALRGRTVTSDDGALSGIASGIDPDGRLMIRRPDGVIARVASGEIRVKVVSR
jgi:BirA family biotin operon repressor/biotin-[acetyl-CoA-carboxylase] ligase